MSTAESISGLLLRWSKEAVVGYFEPVVWTTRLLSQLGSTLSTATAAFVSAAARSWKEVNQPSLKQKRGLELTAALTVLAASAEEVQVGLRLLHMGDEVDRTRKSLQELYMEMTEKLTGGAAAGHDEAVKALLANVEMLQMRYGKQVDKIDNLVVLFNEVSSLSYDRATPVPEDFAPLMPEHLLQRHGTKLARRNPPSR